LANWLRKHRSDPLLRTHRFSEQQAEIIQRRNDLWCFATNRGLLSNELVAKVLATHGEEAQLKTFFRSLDPKDLCACLFAAHRLSFTIFREAWLVFFLLFINK